MDISGDVLVLSPHPDDEVLGCGGLLCRVDSHKIHLLEFTMGSPRRREEFECFMRSYNIADGKIAYDDALHLRLDTLPQADIIRLIEEEIDRIRPEVVAIPFPSFNQDHEVVNRCAITALRSRKKPYYMPRIVLQYEYPQVNWLQNRYAFVPNFYLDISQNIDKKAAMLAHYRSQLKDPQYAVSVEGMRTLAYFRGKEISVLAAEAYQICRWIAS